MLVPAVAHGIMNDDMLSQGPSGAGAARTRAVAGVFPPCTALAAVVALIAQGRQDALARLYDETSPLVNGLLLRILERPEDAEEVLLDVYMKAWKYAATYTEQRGSVQSWLVTMARNTAIDRIRQR